MTRSLRRFKTGAELQRAAAEFIVHLLDAVIRARGVGTLVLSGGSTPKAVYELLGEEPFRSQIEWERVHIFWGDERCVPPTHSESNFRMTKEALLNSISIPGANVHRIQAELQPSDAAEFYSEEIRSLFTLSAARLPRFDCTLLGIGEDGHTASLFPGTTILNESERLVVDVFVPKLNAHRVSMTLPVLNNSRSIVFLVAGAAKATIMREMFEGEQNRFPAQLVRPTNGELYWFVDEAAASMLPDPQTTFQHLQSL